MASSAHSAALNFKVSIVKIEFELFFSLCHISIVLHVLLLRHKMNRPNQSLTVDTKEDAATTAAAAAEEQKLYKALSDLQKSHRECVSCVLSLEEVLEALDASRCSSKTKTIGDLLNLLISDNEKSKISKNSITKETVDDVCALVTELPRPLRGAGGASILARCLDLTGLEDADQSSTKELKNPKK